MSVAQGTASRRVPSATYRVQLHAAFDFDAAASAVPYLARLGISHLYTSPILQAAPGSSHGYDVVDHARISAELGGEAGFERLVNALRTAGMGLVVDLVPNHMAIGGPANRWWWDVLQHGSASRYAAYFDVDWDPPESRLRNVILLPVLDDHYGRVLEAGRISIVRAGDRLEVAVDEQRFPLAPGSLAVTEPRDGPDDATLAALNADADALDGVLGAQNYRLAHWRSASRDLGYRRFFDINSLIGLRVERQDVFEATHRLILERVAAGQIQGLRVDHIDGLRDPQAYLERLRAAAPEAWIVVEKILQPNERLPAAWPVDGTTGYEFAALVNRLLVDPRGVRPLDAIWRATAPQLADWEAVAYAARLDAIAGGLGSDLNRLTELLLAVCEAHRRHRDFTRHELHEALREVVAAVDVYRTYVVPGRLTDADRAVIERAERRATDRRPDLDPELFAFIGGIQRLEVDGPDALELAMRLQQLTPAAMAKGIEDTALYRYLRLTAVNEVGADPSLLGLETGAFHAAMEAVAQEHPATMQATSTHDTKRSEDVRARILQITGSAERYRDVAAGLRGRLAARWPDGVAADPVMFELLIQTLVGSWPISEERLTAYLLKAARETKLRTRWTEPDAAYESAVTALAAGALADPEVTEPVAQLVGELLPAARAASLAQVLLRLTVPGVPDTYQGTELWDASLVDPDNRRPVDFDRRAALLDAPADAPEAGSLARDGEGAVKLWTIRQALSLRHRHPDAFGPGGAYRRLLAEGRAADGLVAFCRGEAVVTVVPRWPLRTAAAWEETSLTLPTGSWRDVLGGGEATGAVTVARLFARLPVALLERVAP